MKIRSPHWVVLGCVATAWCLGMAPIRGGEPASSTDIARWVRELDAADFATRSQATDRLTTVGEAAIKPLQAAAGQGNLEVTERAIGVLQRLTGSEDDASVKAAQLALVELSESKNSSVAKRALKALRFRQDHALALLAALQPGIQMEGESVVAIGFDNTPVTNEHMALVARLTELRYLSLGGTAVGDRGLELLRGLPRLESLNLYRSAVTDAGLEHLATFPKLTHLPIGETRVTDAGIPHLIKLKQLDYLGLRANAITDKGALQLVELKNLTGLYLGETQVTDAGLKGIAGMSRMQSLRLNDTAVTDAGLVQLYGMKDLRQLYISNTGVTANGLAQLKEQLPEVRIQSGLDP